MDTRLRHTLKRTLAVLLAASLAVPAWAGGPPPRGPHARHAAPSHHHAPARHHPHPRHHSSGAGLAIFLGAVVGLAALAAATAEPAPPTVVVQAPPPPVVTAPPVVQAPPVASSAPAYWYFCRELNAYYPHVAQCPGNWEPVAPLPPPPGG